MEYNAIYKCRLCGETYHNGAKTGQEVAELCMLKLNVGLVCTEPQAPRLTATHNCGGRYAGSLGLADFQGWKKHHTPALNFDDRTESGLLED